MGLFTKEEKTKVKSFDPFSPEQKYIQSMLSGYLSKRVGAGLQKYPGQFVAGMSPWERMSLGMLGKYMGEGESPLWEEGRSTLSGLLSGDISSRMSPEITEDYFRESIYGPSLSMMREDIIPEIEGAYAGNYWGTPRASAVGEAWEGFEEDMSSTLSELIWRDEISRVEMEQQGRLSALGMIPGFESARAAGIEGKMTAGQMLGALPRMLKQAELEAQFNEWLRTRPEYNPVIEQALAFAMSPTKQAMLTGGGSSPSIFGSMVGMLGALGGLASGVGAIGGMFGGGAGTGAGAGLGSGVTPWSSLG